MPVGRVLARISYRPRPSPVTSTSSPSQLDYDLRGSLTTLCCIILCFSIWFHHRGRATMEKESLLRTLSNRNGASDGDKNVLGGAREVRGAGFVGSDAGACSVQSTFAGHVVQFFRALVRPLSTQVCSMDPITGYYRDGYCTTGPTDGGRHVVCSQVRSPAVAPRCARQWCQPLATARSPAHSRCRLVHFLL